MSESKTPLTVTFYCPHCRGIVKSAEYVSNLAYWQCPVCGTRLEACCDVDPVRCRQQSEGKRVKYYDDLAREVQKCRH